MLGASGGRVIKEGLVGAEEGVEFVDEDGSGVAILVGFAVFDGVDERRRVVDF